jgi:hypothetical protein
MKLQVFGVSALRPRTMSPSASGARRSGSHKHHPRETGSPATTTVEEDIDNDVENDPDNDRPAEDGGGLPSTTGTSDGDDNEEPGREG